MLAHYDFKIPERRPRPTVERNGQLIKDKPISIEFSP